MSGLLGMLEGNGVELLTITTPLPDTSFGIEALSGTERISQPFFYYIRLHSGSKIVDPDALLDKPITVQVSVPTIGESKRYVNGIVSSVVQQPSQSTELWQYGITVVPRLSILAQTHDNRYFNNKSTLDIIKTILSEYDIVFIDKTTGSFAVRNYTVQFNESYLHFIQRLMDDTGIFYYFVHSDNVHKMVLANSNTAFFTIDKPDIYLQEVNSGIGTLSSWRRLDRTVLGGVRVDDYNPSTDSLRPGSVTGSESTILKASAAPQRTYYGWPAVRGETGGAKSLAKDRMLAAEAKSEVYFGIGQIPDFVAGGKFILVNDPATNIPTEYIIQSLSYQIQNSMPGSEVGYSASVLSEIEAFPSKKSYKNEISLLPPVMAGVYSAVVIGPKDEEIYTDDSGRIQVKFPSDHKNDIVAEKTLWVRVMQGWSGNNWGMHYIPRVGMEVLVAFLESDVNRPVVIGCLQNVDNKPVFSASEKNKTGLRTRSTKSGSATNFSEFSIDDTKGSEVIYVHAEKDMHIEAENDRNVEVLRNETVHIDGRKTDTVKEDYTVIVSEGNASLDVKSGTISHSAAESILLKVGENTIKIDKSSIVFTVGGSVIQMTASGVDVKGGVVQVTGATELELKGGTTKINT